MKVNLFTVLLLVFWPPSYASAEGQGHIVVDCAWVAGYLHGVAVLRNNGTGETALIERVETLARAKQWPDQLRLHLTKRIHLVFTDLAGDAPYSLSADYLYNCTVARGDIPENTPDATGARYEFRIAKSIQ